MRYYHLIVQSGGADSRQRRAKKRKKFWRGVVKSVLALLIVSAITAGVTWLYHHLSGPSSATAAPSTSSSAAPPQSTGGSAGQTASPSAGSVAFTGSVGITFSGIDFDSNPLSSGSYNVTWERYTNTLQGYGSVIVSRYSNSVAQPTEAACRSWAQAHISQILSGVNRGDRLCFITQDGRTVRFIVTNITSDAVEGQATVWNDSNQ